MKKTIIYNIFLWLLLVMTSCTEPYALQSLEKQNSLVVEATFTNELKKHEIKLSRTTTLESTTPEYEKNAVVYISDDHGNIFEFEPNQNSYISRNEIQAVPDTRYKLHIITEGGKTYTSTEQTLPNINEMQSLIPVAKTNDKGNLGVEIQINSFDPLKKSLYYRFEFEETSKIVTPKWSPFETILLNQPMICPGNGSPGFETIGFITKQHDGRICYDTKHSNTILLTNTNNLLEDRVTNFPIRFIETTDYKIGERYTILAKQYVVSLETYTYYSRLKKITSDDSSVLSQLQPGLIVGNIKSTDNSDEIVVGLFDVSSVSKQRIFFNFEDIFPNLSPPTNPYNCVGKDFDSEDFGTPDPRPNAQFPCGNGGQGTTLRSIIRLKKMLYYDSSYPIFTMVEPACGDCTTYSSNIKPTFWID